MNTGVRNIFGVAAAIIVLLGLNAFTGNNRVSLPDYDTEVTKSENRPVATLMDLNEAIVDIAEKTNPAVVTITTEKTQQVRYSDPFSMFFRNPNSQDGQTREYVRRGLGSGVIVSEEGYILTNNHVIADTDEIKIQLFNGDEVSAELIGADPATDIAVLRIDVDNLPVVTLGDSDDARVGSFVLAIGSPLSEDLAHTVSFGIVSARGRSLNNLTVYGDYIQTDAAINPGNSGGALIDMNGELVGINTAIASRSGGNDGIGFAIPVNLAKRIMDDLIDDGSVSRGYLGILPADVDQVMAEALGLENVRGILVASVEEDTPADIAGLQEEDIIIAVNGDLLNSGDANAFRTLIASFKPGKKVDLTVIRDGSEKKITVTLGTRPGEETTSNTSGSEDIDEKLGFKVSGISPEIRRQLNLSNDKEGVVVTEIRESSNAFERGLERGDVISAVKRKKVSTAEQFYKEIEKSVNKGDEAVLLTVERNNQKQFIAFRL
ncbi:MAG: Do family serine endopeptidase [Balneola sp.]|nr:MAG: Do family serine endopeptidase [Balneola sp.]